MITAKKFVRLHLQTASLVDLNRQTYWGLLSTEPSLVTHLMEYADRSANIQKIKCILNTMSNVRTHLVLVVGRRGCLGLCLADPVLLEVECAARREVLHERLVLRLLRLQAVGHVGRLRREGRVAKWQELVTTGNIWSQMVTDQWEKW